VDHFFGDSAQAREECEATLQELGIRLRHEQQRLYERIQQPAIEQANADSGNEEANTGIEPELLRTIAGIWHSYRLQIGVPIIDMQHLWLIKLVVELERLDRKRLAGPVTTAEIAEKFNAAVVNAIDYVNEHFSTEEGLMRKFNFPGFANHVHQHKQFVAFINERNAEHRAGNTKALNHLVQDLKEWLISHIAIEDKRIYFFLHKRMDEVSEYVRGLARDHQLIIRPGYLELYNTVVRFQTPAAGRQGHSHPGAGA
jgi:hemerythrin-like metal-binding protein